ncbi:MAG TPA: pyridoxamine 5'-phosphate oxidase family protein [Xanthobacteraceae bacterium]|nr:pyridoxamine 5'-phosphate oxidase family protein [Xanthobacteraceae bacterium]
MKAALKQLIVHLLDEHRIMTIATNRPDGWPQATVVGYANDALVLYTFITRNSQKYANIELDPRVSIAIAKDYPQPLLIKGLSMAARALVIEDSSEVDHATALLRRRHPEYKVLPRPNPAEVPLIRITPGDFDPRLFQGFRARRSGQGVGPRPGGFRRKPPSSLGGPPSRVSTADDSIGIEGEAAGGRLTFRKH